MEQELGRPLASDELVHHIDLNRLNNDPANLKPVTTAEHGREHTKHPVTKTCTVCGASFTPHKTKRARQKTCGLACGRVQMWRTRQGAP
jgi:HNH endonuclease